MLKEIKKIAEKYHYETMGTQQVKELEVDILALFPKGDEEGLLTPEETVEIFDDYNGGDLTGELAEDLFRRIREIIKAQKLLCEQRGEKFDPDWLKTKEDYEE